ncbi:MAG TPA: ferritin family protein [Phycisphaerales bacterium]|nr:ferritin family protein [Phycisphaerales bacterium]
MKMARIGLFAVGVAGAFLMAASGTAMGQAAGAAQAPGKVEPRKTEKTVESLRAAHAASVRAGDFYTQAAKKADEEGVTGAASLLRAAAKAESVHAARFSKQLEEMKSSTVKPTDKSAPDVKTTKENLAAAVKLASAARETDLPAGRKVADSEGVREAAKLFRDARESQIELVRLFKDAAETSDEWKKGKRDFYIGRSCGYIVEKLDLTKCPVCGKGRDDFEKVN